MRKSNLFNNVFEIVIPKTYINQTNKKTNRV